MGKKNKYEKQQVFAQAKNEDLPGPANSVTYSPFQIKIFLAFVIALLAMALYVQTIGYEYTLDDPSAITENKLVKQGIGGIPELLTTDYWFGYTERSRGQLYRPLPLVSFAIEQQFFPQNPHVGHGVNVLLYVFTCVLLFLLMCRLLPGNNFLVPFVSVLLYTCHPIHTEVVSNIKSRDEILCFLFGIGAMFSALAYIRSGKISYLLASGFLLFLSIMSKETGIAFLLLIPLTAYVFREVKIKNMVALTISLAAFTGLYLLLRYQVVHEIEIMEIVPLDNTLVMATSPGENYGTVFHILFRYIGLLLVPVTLSYDYSFAQIHIVNMGDAKAIIGLVLYLAMAIFAISRIWKKNYYAYAILFFLLSLAPVSNLFLKIGSTMAERFLYIPSFGFCLALGLFFSYLSRQAGKSHSAFDFFRRHAFTIALTCVVSLFYAFKTVNRNPVWKNNENLFTSGLTTSENSARVHYNMGIINLYNLAPAASDSLLKKKYMSVAKSELEMALNIYPNYFDAAKPLSDIYLQEKNLQKSGEYADKFLLSSPDDKDIQYIKLSLLNIKAASLVNARKYSEAIKVLDSILVNYPADTTALKNMGKAYAFQSQFTKAMEYFERNIAQAPGIADNWRVAGMVYQFMGETDKAKQYLNRADSLLKNKK